MLPGTLDLLVLRVLDRSALHGYGIARRIESLSDDVLRIEQGSLYPALYRLEEAGLVRASWGTSDSGRRVRVFRLTSAGKRRMKEELQSWEGFVEAVGKVVRAEGEA